MEEVVVTGVVVLAVGVEDEGVLIASGVVGATNCLTEEPGSGWLGGIGCEAGATTGGWMTGFGGTD